MLWNVSSIIGYGIEATDGAIGTVEDFLFDDRSWSVRWLVVDTGKWLPGRRVLLPPAALAEPDPAKRVLPVRLTRAQVEGAPDLDSDAPVSRQHETELFRHYALEPYWVAGYDPILGGAPAVPPPAFAEAAGGKPGTSAPEGDKHLRATREVIGSYLHASDGEIGHVDEFLLETTGWALRYVVVDTRNWWPGKKVLLGTPWFHDIDWAENSIRVDLTREQVKKAPGYDPSKTVDRAYEEQLHGHYGAPVYWD